MTGFRAAEASRPFEAGGEVATKREMAEERDARRNLMSRWRAKSGGARSSFFSHEIREWNKTHKGKDRITYSKLQRSLRAKKAQREELEEAMNE